ncbi:hypothetical protein FIBSPDRAFT_943417 [Athelia psychrophila]|uniref:Uncharacterized protein n=1 Tax=Athelia psychrophila TaxID=1759441 RepID=A0A166WCY2_9AGAM|nr:hypothetical protein FIBSPDRAFT_943417 [Fibularhizoctonia sp. CBS 109695]
MVGEEQPPARQKLRPRPPPAPINNAPLKNTKHPLATKKATATKKKPPPSSPSGSASASLPPESEEGQSPACSVAAHPSARPAGRAANCRTDHHGITQVLPSWTTLPAEQKTPVPEGHTSSSLTPLPASLSHELSDSSASASGRQTMYQRYREAREAHILAKVSDAPGQAGGASAHTVTSVEDDASGVAPVTPPRCTPETTQPPHGLPAKHSYRPSSRTSTKASASSGDDSLPGAPPPMQYTNLFGLDDPQSPSVSHTTKPQTPTHL